MQSEILKELELLPMWKLRKPLPNPEQDLPATAPADEVALAPAEAEVVVEKDTLAMPVTAYASATGDVMLVHATLHLDQDAGTLLQNIAKSLPHKFYAVAGEQTLAALQAENSPKVIMLMGEALAQVALKSDDDLSAMREKVHAWHDAKAVVSYDLSQVLSQNVEKQRIWQDCCLLLSLLDDKN